MPADSAGQFQGLSPSMATMIIRHLDAELKAKLRIRGAHHARSMEDETREILRSTSSTDGGQKPSLLESIRSRVAPVGGIKLELPRRGSGDRVKSFFIFKSPDSRRSDQPFRAIS